MANFISKRTTHTVLFSILFVSFVISVIFMMDFDTMLSAFNPILEGTPLYAERAVHIVYFLIFGITIPVLISFWARKKQTKKPYLVYFIFIFAYTIPLIISSLDCSGESCMVWLMMPILLLAPILIFVVWHTIGWLIVKFFNIDNADKLLYLLFGILILAWLIFGLDKVFLKSGNNVDYYVQRAIETEDPKECYKVDDVLFDDKENQNSILMCLSDAEAKILKPEFCEKIKDSLDVTFYYNCLAKIIYYKNDPSLCDKILDIWYKPEICKKKDLTLRPPTIHSIEELVVHSGEFDLVLNIPGNVRVIKSTSNFYQFIAPIEIGDGAMYIAYNPLSKFDSSTYFPLGAESTHMSQTFDDRSFFQFYSPSVENYEGVYKPGIPLTVYATNSGDGMLQIEIYGNEKVTKYFWDILFNANIR